MRPGVITLVGGFGGVSVGTWRLVLCSVVPIPCPRKAWEHLTTVVVAVQGPPDVRYSFAEKCENCTARESPLRTMAIKLEQVESTASSWSSHRQLSNLGTPPGLDARQSNASSSTISLTRSGREATVSNCNRRWALSF